MQEENLPAKSRADAYTAREAESKRRYETIKNNYEDVLKTIRTEADRNAEWDGEADELRAKSKNIKKRQQERLKKISVMKDDITKHERAVQKCQEVVSNLSPEAIAHLSV